MAKDFSQFLPSSTIPLSAHIVGYDANESGGERRFTFSTIANAVSGIIAPSFAQTPAFTGTFKNKIINGNFDIWQRGTSLPPLTGGRYLADRWTNESEGTTCTAAQSAFALGQTSVPNEPTYYISTAVTSVVGASNNATLHQHIEGVRSCAGKTVTLSFYAKSNASRNIAVELYQNFGTGGTPSTSVSIPVGLKALTTSWQKFTVTTNIPSISGKTLGTSGDDSLVVYFWFDAGSNPVVNARASSLGQQSGTFDIAQVQLEEGSFATPFELRPIGTELALCQRYYYKALDPNTTGLLTRSIPSQSTQSITTWFHTIIYPLPVQMRSFAVIEAAAEASDTGAIITTSNFNTIYMTYDLRNVVASKVNTSTGWYDLITIIADAEL